MRRLVLRTLAALVVLAPSLWPKAAPRLEELADQLAQKPNAPQLHLETARAYFTRGAQGDAIRVRRHLERAVQLSPGMEEAANQLLQDTPPGVTGAPIDPAERLLDERIQASLAQTAGVGGSRPRDSEAIIQASLAERMVKRDLEKRATSMEEAREEFAEVLEWESSGGRGDWPDRLQRIQGRRARTGWQGTWQSAVFGAIRRFNSDGAGSTPAAAPAGGTPPEESPDRSPPEPGASGMEDSAGKPIPEPLARKNQAVMDFYQGKVAEAVVGLIDTVAAAEVRRNLAAAREVDAVPEVPGDSGEAPEPGEEAEPPPPPAGAPQAGQMPRETPPELVGTLGQAALETLEAMRNPEVSPEEVETKMAETAALGAVGEPLLLDLDGDGAPGTFGGLLPDGRVEPTGSVRFDLDGDGHREWTEWLRPGRDGLLAVDLDGDGAIGSGRELFGTAWGHRDGFARLRVFDLDGDGWISGTEGATLLVWRDDGDGRSQPGELHGLGELGVEAIACRPEQGLALARTRAGERRVWDWLPDTRPFPLLEVAAR
jgi:hypothetical protein